MCCPFQKLTRRLKSLEKTPLSEKDKERAQEILLASNAVEYISSEESDIGATENESSRGPKPRKIRKLGWERTKLRNLKARIDESRVTSSAVQVHSSQELAGQFGSVTIKTQVPFCSNYSSSLV